MSKNQVVITSVTPEDKTLWSEYVSSHPAATAYHQYAWVEAVKKALEEVKLFFEEISSYFD